MKRLLLFIPLLMATSVFSQEFYLKGGLGYSVPHGSQPYDAFGNAYAGTYSSKYNAATGTETSFTIKKPSLTAGLGGTIGVGILVNKNVGVELAANVGIITKKHVMHYENNDGTKNTTATITQQAKSPILLVPALVLQTGGDKWSLYSRTGLVVPVQTSYTMESVSNTESLLFVQNVEYEVYKEKFSTRFGVGFSAAAGVKYHLADVFSVFTELNITSLTLYARESEVTEYLLNGVNYTSAIPNEYRTTQYEFKSSASTTSNSSTYSTYAIPYGNFGFTAGVLMSLH